MKIFVVEVINYEYGAHWDSLIGAFNNRTAAYEYAEDYERRYEGSAAFVHELPYIVVEQEEE